MAEPCLLPSSALEGPEPALDAWEAWSDSAVVGALWEPAPVDLGCWEPWFVPSFDEGYPKERMSADGADDSAFLPLTLIRGNQDQDSGSESNGPATAAALGAGNFWA